MGWPNETLLWQQSYNQYCTWSGSNQTKHMDIDKQFIKEKLDSWLICTPYVSIDRQLADILIKSLSSTIFQESVSKLGMENIYSLS